MEDSLYKHKSSEGDIIKSSKKFWKKIHRYATCSNPCYNVAHVPEIFQNFPKFQITSTVQYLFNFHVLCEITKIDPPFQK